MNKLFSPVSQLKGVGEKRAAYYKKLGVSTVYDLLYHLPRGYVDLSCPVSVADAPVNEYCVLKGRIVMKMPEQRIRKDLRIFKAKATDGLNDFMIIIYNNFYGFKALQTGQEYLFYGKVTGNLLRKEISSPKVVKADTEPFMPVYPLTTGLTSAAVIQNMREAVLILESEPFDSMPTHILLENNLISLPHALKSIHFPSSSQEADAAARRLAFDELLILQLGMLTLKEKSRKITPCAMNENTDISEFYGSLPFELTGAQLKSINEINTDMCSGSPMNRLLQGDVGSGKTAAAAAACFFAYKNGYQSALMAPTEILAMQHYKTLVGFLEPLGVKTVLLTGSMTAKEKREVKKQLADGEAAVAVGTHAIIQKDVEFSRLGLVITDEQHRFGVAQRAALAGKGTSPHKLVMSATPIPRTLALIIYGDLDISVINEMPKGRIPVKTYAVTGKLRKRAFNFIKKQLDEGRQAYIVCPVIEDSETDMLAAKSYAEKVKGEDFADYSVGLLHGKMRSSEKEQTMNDFKEKKIDLLICTTVVEVGVDVPNASVMMIENAERFGLSQLHQLRGRVGRGSFESHCILVTDNTGEECVRRMKIMSGTSDGFKISEEDLKMRGPGDFFGSRQHGLPPLKMAELAGNMELVSDTRSIAEKLLKDDPMLEKKENRGLKTDMLKFFEKDIVG
ncbi:MAG: ATP-dependent DNA helicase RecG [Clostridium sp.]|nr:ATP-dependent DNA helicase RecG [Clostridium sp.]MCM1547487.1 ATP-dependent DNA helicase RecG [Ruminococcus sp.]